MLYGREAQYPIDLFYPKPPGDPRLELGEVGAGLSDKLFEVHSHAQLTIGKEQRRQKDYYQKKVHGKSFKIGDRPSVVIRATQSEIPKVSSPLARSIRSIESDKWSELSDLQARLPGKVAKYPF